MNTSTDSPYSTTTANPGQNLPITPVAMLFLFGAAGNILAMIVLIYSSKIHKWRTFYRLVGALAVSDFIGILGPLPISLAAYSNNKKWIGGQLVCDIMSFFFIFAGLASASLAGAMSLDRFLAIKKPHFYTRYATKRRVNIMMAILWVSAFIVACMPIVGLNKNIRQYPGTWCFFNFVATEAKDKFFSFLFASLGTLVIVLMIVLNTLVTFDLGKRCMQARKKKRRGTQNTQMSSSNINDVYNMIFLIVLMAVFSICWIPLMIRIFINQTKLTAEPEVDLLAMRLAITNQIMDPWIYILLRKDSLALVLKFVKSHCAQCPCAIPDENSRSDKTNSTSRSVPNRSDVGHEGGSDIEGSVN